jgi:lipoprotein-anchoring transpeptidase ErfK/SrfK
MSNPDVAYVSGDVAKLRAAAGEVALQPAERARILAEGPLSADGRWTLWTKPPRLVLSVSGSGNPNRQLQYYDANSCQCTPADATAAAEAVAAWQNRQEHEVVLRSAELAFRKRHGRLPQSLEELTGNYPDNSLSGITREMKAVWEAQKGQQPPGSLPPPADGKTLAETTGAGGTDKGANTATPAATAPPHQSKPRGIGVAPAQTPFAEPLSIIVDRATYRLALVSGTVILRNYPVGLGGKKTPEGKFVVTEKVNKPNGKSVGPFGSRGMTLSDTLYAIHGTDEPDSIGKDESQGCVRMLKGDLEELYAMTPLGTPVTITSDKLPTDITRAKNRLQLPARAEEMNPAKVYSWLH